MKPFVRPAVRGDEAAIHEAHMRSIREVCIHDHSEEEIRGWGNRPLGDRWIKQIQEGHVWVVELEGVVRGVGYIKIDQDQKTAHIFALYLAPEVLKHGMGQQLMKLMLEKARAENVKRVTLESSLTAHDFYKRFGFVDTGPMNWTEIGGSRVSGFPMALEIAL